MKTKLTHPNAKLPTKKREGDAGYDLVSIEDYILQPGEIHKFSLGLIVEIPEDSCALVQERSGMALKSGIITIGNVIDSNYRGEISAILLNTGKKPITIEQGDRIAQLLVFKVNNEKFTETDELSETNRGSDGFGSSGK